MSTILDAMRKSSQETADIGFRLATLDTVNLYPPPKRRLLGEFEQIANALIARHQEAAIGQVVTFASTVSGEGGSFVSYNVARQMSFLLNRRIAWVDANFLSPQRRLDGEAVGFRDLLQNPDLFAEINMGSGLVLIDNGDAGIKTTDLLRSQHYTALLEHFRRHFYYTIIDAPPVLESIDAAHLAAPTMGLVLVVESRRLKYEVIRHGLEELGNQKISVLGTVLNRRRFDLPGFLYRRM